MNPTEWRKIEKRSKIKVMNLFRRKVNVKTFQF